MWTELIKFLGDLIVPDDYLDSIYAVDFAKLKDKNIQGLLIDLDNTLVGRYEAEPSLKCRSWIEAAKQAGFSLCISSNSFYPNRVRHVAESLQVPSFFMAAKPLPWSLNVAAQRILNLPSSEIALIGDQLFTDTLGGNLADMYTILVNPLEVERVSARKIMRSLEQAALRSCGVAMNG